MNKQLAEAVRNQFALQMTMRLPAFIKLTEPDVYALKLSSDIVFFVHLSIADGKDSFVVEIAANEDEQFPWTELPGMVRDIAGSAKKRVWRFRISTLSSEPTSRPWLLGTTRDAQAILKDVRNKTYLKPIDVSPQLLEVEPKLRDAVDKVCELGIPYFRLAAEARGVTKIEGIIDLAL